jgi:nitrate reductase beta subunit
VSQSDDTAVDLAEGIDHQVAMVMDLNKCIGCQTCTIACKTNWTDGGGREYMYWNNVETKPGSGYPHDWEEMGGGWDEAGEERQDGALPSEEEYGRAWEFNHDEIFYEGSDEPLRPMDQAVNGPNWDEDEGAGEFPNSYYFYLPRICNHCTHPSCVEACPRSALYKREEDGIVLVDQDRCRGYRYCVEGCPYKKVYYNAMKKTSEKCIFCYPRIEGEGPDDEVRPPSCAADCPPQLRHVGFIDDEDGPIYKLVEEHEVAVRLHPEYRTEPNVYYIPPFAPPQHSERGESLEAERIPRDYLVELFGSEVNEALNTIQRERDRVARGEESEVMDLLTNVDYDEQYRLEVFE